MAGLRLVALGVGDAFSALHYSTALALVSGDGAWLLVDCPHPIRKVLREASLSSGVELPFERLVGVAVTHLHADHASGLEGLGYFHRYALRRAGGVLLFAGPLVAEQFRLRPEAECFTIHPVAEGTTVAAGPFQIRARAVRHG